MENRPPEEGDSKLYLFIAIGFMVAGAVALGVSFTVLGRYALIACMVLVTVAMTFINLQRRKKDFKWLLYFRIGAYILFVVPVVLFITGIV